MTTIAYRNGIIAYDSRATRGDLIATDNREKRREKNGVIFVLSGRQDHIEAMMSLWFGEEIEIEPNSHGFVIAENVLWEIGYDEDFVKLIFDPAEYHAFGSGDYHAITAMDMGASAVEAVQMAMKRDVYTGGEIRTIKGVGYE